ncbi:MAG: hypothetical protein JWM95_3194 [Gemmatimonadetes bacterium]|nr:hypothetical protein [Gemmatimonadota bacterium]
MTIAQNDHVIATPSYRTAAGVALGVFALYLLTLAPTIGLWDSGEYVAAAVGMGIPHPPGNPGFLLLGRLATMLPLARTAAMRLNVLVALASALSSGLWFLVAEHVVRHWLTVPRARYAAAACAILGATAFTVWNQSVVNEKVYTISLFLLVLDVWTAIRWQSNPDGPAADRRLMLICYRLGLGYTVHIAGLLAGPAVLAAVLYTRPSTLRRTRFLMACGALFLLGFTPFAALPIRAAFRLDINEGHPTACEDGRPHWGCTVSRETVNRFLYAHNRTQYAKPSILDRQQTLPNQVAMWWMYFKWQWLRDVRWTAPEAQSALAILMLLLAGAGAYAHWRYDRQTFVPFATLVATLTAGLIVYLNFKLGYTQAITMMIADPNARETRDRDYFYLWSFSALAIWIGLGLAFVWKALSEFSTTNTPSQDDPWAELLERRWPLTSVVLAVALIPFFANWSSASRRADRFAQDFAVDMLNSVEPNAILFTGGDNDSFPLWFAQQVLGVRRDVSVVLTPYLSTDWYARELIARVPEPYDAATGPAIYRTVPVTPLRQPVLDFTLAQADSIPAHTRTLRAQSVRMPGFDLTIPAMTIDRDVLVMMRIIQTAGRARPVYFSGAAGSEVIDNFLKPHLLTQGLARKVVPNAAAIPGAIMTKHVGLLDVARTQSLWDHLHARESMGARGVWTDEASANMPYLYLRIGVALADAQDSTGNHAGAKRLRDDVLRMGRAVDFVRYLRRGPVLEAPTGLGYAPVIGR